MTNKIITTSSRTLYEYKFSIDIDDLKEQYNIQLSSYDLGVRINRLLKAIKRSMTKDVYLTSTNESHSSYVSFMTPSLEIINKIKDKFEPIEKNLDIIVNLIIKTEHFDDYKLFLDSFYERLQIIDNVNSSSIEINCTKKNKI